MKISCIHSYSNKEIRPCHVLTKDKFIQSFVYDFEKNKRGMERWKNKHENKNIKDSVTVWFSLSEENQNPISPILWYYLELESPGGQK